jgi:hypothetical protein
MLQFLKRGSQRGSGVIAPAAVNARWTRRSQGPATQHVWEEVVGQGADSQASAATRVVSELVGVAASSRPLRFGFIGGGVMAEGEL